MKLRLLAPTLVYLSLSTWVGHVIRSTWDRPKPPIPPTSATQAPPVSPSQSSSPSRPRVHYKGTNPTPKDWVSFQWINGPGYSNLHVKNQTALPLTCQVTLQNSHNSSFSPPLPLVFSLRGLENKVVCRQNNLNPYQESQWYTNTLWFLGLRDRYHVPEVAYRLPFASGLSARAASVPNDTALPIPYMFQVPEDTAVVASRDGKVVFTEQRYDQNGLGEEMQRRVNQVIVMHPDGTLAHYRHLRPQGVTVKVGQQVSAGQSLGYSGQTGQCNGPVLGFQVTRLTDELQLQSLVLKFDTKGDGQGEKLTPWESYQAP